LNTIIAKCQVILLVTCSLTICTLLSIIFPSYNKLWVSKLKVTIKVSLFKYICIILKQLKVLTNIKQDEVWFNFDRNIRLSYLHFPYVNSRKWNWSNYFLYDNCTNVKDRYERKNMRPGKVIELMFYENCVTFFVVCFPIPMLLKIE
jgi:hypothetical protein